jgi:DNA-binding IclR family transcriptional regulator
VSKGNQSVERGALVLKTLSEHGSLGVTDIARQIGLPKSITYRLLASLKSADLVRQEPKSRRYTLGYGFLQMTANWLARIEVRTVAMPFLRQLRHDTHETIGLNVRDGDDRVTVERLDTSFEVRYVIELGRPFPMHIGAAGKAILAFLPEDEITEIVARADLSPPMETQLMKDLADVRRFGVSDTCGERVTGSRSISAPIFNHEGAAIASISVLTLQSRMQRREGNNCRRLVKIVAMEISNEMGAGLYSSVA